jgi:hypothetical protein
LTPFCPAKQRQHTSGIQYATQFQQLLTWLQWQISGNKGTMVNMFLWEYF